MVLLVVQAIYQTLQPLQLAYRQLVSLVVPQPIGPNMAYSHQVPAGHGHLQPSRYCCLQMREKHCLELAILEYARGTFFERY